MTKSERIKLIQQLAARLGQERWELADFTLQEMGFQIQNWNGNLEDYLLHVLRKGSDPQLMELAAHLSLSGPVLAVDATAELRLWKPGLCRCFLSHTSKHKVEAATLKADLLAYGCDAFVAHEDIDPTAEWMREIENALASCHCLLAFITDDFHTSRWTDQEVGFVLGRALPVVPIRAGEDPYGLMGKLQAVTQRHGSSADLAEPVFVALNKKPQTAQFVASGAVESFLASPNFAEAKRRMGILERLTHLTPELKERLKDAASKNGQIADAFGVPDRLDTLLASTVTW